MEYKDYYKTLGLEKTASEDEIKKAYRKLARKYHPDVSKEANAEKHMRDINEAKNVLVDAGKRTAYDQLGDHYQAGQSFEQPSDWGAGFEHTEHGFSGTDSAEFSDFFANLFGQTGAGFGGTARGRNHQERGNDRHAKIQITLADTYHGTTQTIALQAQERDASGRIVLKQHNLKVRIPKGVKEGQHIRLTGKGGHGFGGGSAGDLFLEIQFISDSHYRIDNRDVYQTLPITPWEAALGATIEVATPDGNVKLTVPPNSQSGRKLRLKGRGIPAVEAGDLYMVLEIILPPADTPNARLLYETMARELSFNPRQNFNATQPRGAQ